MAPSRKHRKPRSKRPAPVSPIPPGYRTVTAYLTVDGGLAALEFYKHAFGARELMRRVTPDGKLIHGQLRIGDSIVLLSDRFPDSTTAAPSAIGTTTVSLHLYSKNVDALWDRAVAAGAKVSMPLENQFWGERYGRLIDPFGHHWSLAMRVRMSRAEMAAKQREAEASFARGEHPSRDSPYGDA
ncbi:MAG: VOC family protein [Thermoplasmata archaeon]